MSPVVLPSWLPPWIELALLLLAVPFGFVLLLMPFAVFGLKGRLEVIEGRLEDLGADIRMLSGRISESRRAPPPPPEDDVLPVPAPREARRRGPAPLPPRPVEPGFDRPGLDRPGPDRPGIDRRDEPDPAAPPPPRSRDRERWFDPDEEQPPLRPLRASAERPADDRPATDRSPLDRDRDPDRLRYSGRSRTGSGDRGGEREEPSLRWPPR